MKRISKTSFITKWLLPIFLFGIVGTIVLGALMFGDAKPLAILPAVIIGAATYFMMKSFVWGLADEVYDCGEFLLVRKGGQEQKVYLNDIVNINHTSMSSPPRITIICRTPGPLGTEISFTGPVTFNVFKTPPLVVDLIERVDRTRRR